MKVKQGETIPLSWVCPTGATNKVVKAYLYNALNTLIAGPVALAAVANGLYAVASVAMPGTRFVNVVYEIFENDGTTPSVDTDDRYSAFFALNTDVFVTSLTGFLDDHTSMPIRETVQIVRGESKQIAVTMIQARDSFVPLDVSAATEIIARFILADQSKLEKKLSLGDVTVVTGPAGQISVHLASVDTVNLRLSDRQNMEVEVQFGSTVNIVQIIGKVNVRDTVTI